MHFPDLTPYRYSSNPMPLWSVVNVGWLEEGHVFPEGETPPRFIECLRLWVKGAVAIQHRGLHFCDFCPRDIADLSRRGSRVILVRGRGVHYACPELIVHYVGHHRYLPPPEFVKAVLDLSALEGWDAEAELDTCYRALGGR